MSGDWEYLPEKKGILSLSIGNGNQSYSSAIMKEINEQLKDSTFNFDDLNLEYFKHYYAEIRNNIELFNGFQLWTGVSYHRRIPVKKKSDISNPGEGIEEIINDNYHDFTPVVGFSYTPRPVLLDGRISQRYRIPIIRPFQSNLPVQSPE